MRNYRKYKKINIVPKIVENDEEDEKINLENMKKCEEQLKKLWGNSSDVVIQPFDTTKGKAIIVYVDGLVSKDLLDRDIVSPLKSPRFSGSLKDEMHVTQYEETNDSSKYIMDILDGNVAVFFENSNTVFTVDLKTWDKRSIETPDAEAVLRGPKEGFTETIRINTSLIRRKIKTPKLIFENLMIGRQTNTKIELCYIDDIVNVNVLSELRKRLAKIDTDAILDSGQIEQFIEDSPLYPFATIGSTQKPDVAAGKILEGRIAILCDGTPHVLTLPHLLVENFQTSEDYYNRFFITSLLRVMRAIAFLISIMLPGFYVALVTFNQEMIPTIFLVTLASSRESVPFPTAVEAFLMLFFIELLRESGTRLPKPIGTAISIVGALVVGDAAVNAGIVGAPMVIIIAITAVSSFIIPNLTELMTFYRYIFLFLGAFIGILGIGAGIIVILAQLTASASFGIPYCSLTFNSEFRDFIPKLPIWLMKERPKNIANRNIKRQV